jgi:hypothetical protein
MRGTSIARLPVSREQKDDVPIFGAWLDGCRLPHSCGGWLVPRGPPEHARSSVAGCCRINRSEHASQPGRAGDRSCHCGSGACNTKTCRGFEGGSAQADNRTKDQERNGSKTRSGRNTSSGSQARVRHSGSGRISFTYRVRHGQSCDGRTRASADTASSS